MFSRIVSSNKESKVVFNDKYTTIGKILFTIGWILIIVIPIIIAFIITFLAWAFYYFIRNYCYKSK